MSQSTSAPRHLESYACGQWQQGEGQGQPVVDAIQGEVIAYIDATGLDYQAMLDHGRTQGGPALQAMTVHERALMIKELGLALLEAKEELYASSTLTGATPGDSWIDIGGGIGTPLSYFSKGRPEHPNPPGLPDGDFGPLSREGRFSAEHILAPKP